MTNQPTKEIQDVTSAFNQMQNNNEVTEILKELFDENKIYMISELSKDEIKLATRIYTIAKLKKIESWETGLAFYCKLMLSKDRSSRKEIIMAINGAMGMKRGFFGRLFNRPEQMQPMNPMNMFR